MLRQHGCGALRPPHRRPALSVEYGYGQLPEYELIDSRISACLIAPSESARPMSVQVRARLAPGSRDTATQRHWRMRD